MVFEVELQCTGVRSRVRASHFELPRSSICQVRVRVRIFVEVRGTEFRFEIESEFRFHLFSCTAPEWSPDPEKCFPNVPRHPPTMLPEGLWKPLQGTAWRRPGKGPKKTTLSNKSIITVPWGIARENAGLPPSHSLSHPLKGMASQQLQLAVAGSQCSEERGTIWWYLWLSFKVI